MIFNESSKDEELMQAYQNGAETAFDLLFARYSSRVYGFLVNQLRDREQANEVFQNCFLKLHQSRKHYDPAFPFTPWLFTVCKSVMTDHFRKQQRNREDSREKLIASAVDTSSIEPLESAEIALDALPLQQREALQMRYQEDLPFEEIALRLSTTPSNVRKLVSRGVQRLKTLNRKKGEEL